MAERTARRRRNNAVRLAAGTSAVVTLGGGALVAATLPFSVPASAKSSLLGKTLTIRTARVAKLGTVLASASGQTLYHFTSDPLGKVTCTGVCAKVWPPLLLPKGVTRVKAPQGVRGLSALRMADGRWQVFFHDQALYTFVSDTKKGEAKGQGVGNVWFACLADGKSSAVHPASTASSSSTGGTGTVGSGVGAAVKTSSTSANSAKTSKANSSTPSSTTPNTMPTTPNTMPTSGTMPTTTTVPTSPPVSKSSPDSPPTDPSPPAPPPMTTTQPPTTTTTQPPTSGVSY